MAHGVVNNRCSAVCRDPLECPCSQPAPVFWLADGSLPPGLQLDTTGLLHGTATAPAAKHTFKVAAGNSAGMLASPDLSLTIS